MIPAREALARLKDGNSRFVANVRNPSAHDTHDRRAELATGQHPFAIILGCSDSRVPAELVFDQGLGDLFVIRVAGNIVAPSQVGSVEFAVAAFDTRLVVVLGHSMCGAIKATIDQMTQKQRASAGQSRGLRAIVDRIRPSVATLIETPLRNDPPALEQAAVRANIRASVAHLQHGSEIIEQHIRDEGLVIVGAEYSLETGAVEFFDSDSAA